MKKKTWWKIYNLNKENLIGDKNPVQSKRNQENQDKCSNILLVIYNSLKEKGLVGMLSPSCCSIEPSRYVGCRFLQKKRQIRWGSRLVTIARQYVLRDQCGQHAIRPVWRSPAIHGWISFCYVTFSVSAYCKTRSVSRSTERTNEGAPRIFTIIGAEIHGRFVTEKFNDIVWWSSTWGRNRRFLLYFLSFSLF